MENIQAQELQPLKKRSDAWTDEVIAEALRKSRGLQYLAAESIGMDAGNMSKRIADSPYLQKARDEARERRIDVAERSLAELTEEKNLGSVCFLLKTLGKTRGYVETTEINVSPEIFKNHAALMEQMAEFQESRKTLEIKSNTEDKSE
jgi:hypothetical protein